MVARTRYQIRRYHQFVPMDAVLKTMNLVHRMIRRITRGRLGWTMMGMQTVELTTTGRRTGRQHTVMLTSPAALDGCIVLVASRGGDDHHPAWFLNLRDCPTVRVRLSEERTSSMTARVATDDERAVLWPKITTAHPRYANYQAKTSRQIPLVLVKPH